MMNTPQITPIPVTSSPGIQRDGTTFSAKSYIDGRWTRFQRGLPRKMGGYRQVTPTLPERVRGMRADMSGGSIFLHAGSATKLTQVITDYQGILSNQVDRTPAGFAGDQDNIWTLDTFTETLSGTLQIIACATPCASNIASNTAGKIYYGDLDGSSALVQAFSGETDPEVSGGVVALWPFFMGFGSNGEVKWTAPNDLTAWNTRYIVSGSKIVKGMPMRGNGNGPAVILWSLTDVIQGQYSGFDAVGGSYLFNFSTLATQSSVLSTQGFIEYNGVYYWMGIDSFMMFNGVVGEVPNSFNVNWVFENLNFEQRQKAFAYKVPRFGEIWFCFPFGNATECTHAAIYNVREQVWYDTELPEGMRTAGAFAQSYRFPFMADGEINPVTSAYTLWQHETGYDRITNTPPSISAIQAKIRSSYFSPVKSGADMGFRIARTEPDIKQKGPMQVRVVSQANARAPEVVNETFTFQEAPTTDTQDQPVNMKTAQRFISLEFESNAQGGDFQMGASLGFVAPETMRNTGP